MTENSGTVRSKYLHSAYIKRKIWNLRWLPIRLWFYVRHFMQLRVSRRNPEDGEHYRFIADSLHSYQRAKTLLSKEPGTIEWIKDRLGPSGVLLDIGANVGTFSIYAARHLSPSGHVYACEPHLPTAVQLMQNISENQLTDRVSVITAAISNEDGLIPFRYKRWRPGASGSQLLVEGGPGLENHVGTELKTSVTIDTLIERGHIRPPDLIKIDTDGVEVQIVSG